MTPDEARALLDGAAPGEWQWDVTGNVAAVDGDGWEDVADYVSESNAALIAAAPALAEMIAGMVPEYMALNRVDENGEWHKVTRWSPEWPFRPGHTPDPRFDKVIRRYVTTPEEA